MKPYLLSVALLSTLTACGGDSSSDGSDNNQPIDPPIDNPDNPIDPDNKGPINIELTEFDNIVQFEEEDLLARLGGIEGNSLSVSNVVLETDMLIEGVTSITYDEKGMYVKPSEMHSLLDEGDSETIEYSFDVTNDQGDVTSTSIFFNIAGSDNVKISEMTFPDANFADCVLEEAADEDITYDAEMHQLNCYGPDKDEEENADSELYIESIEGIAQLKGLTDFYISQSKITSMDISQNVRLEELGIYDGELTSIDLSKNPKLVDLRLNENNLTEIDVSKNPLLTGLYLTDNNLNSIDISMLEDLGTLRVDNNNLSSIDLTKNTKLNELIIDNNNLSEIDISKAENLSELSVYNNHNIEILDLSNNPELRSIRLGSIEKDEYGNMVTYSKIEELDLSNNLELRSVNVNGSLLSSLNLSLQENLEWLYVEDTNINSLNLEFNHKLDRIYAENAKLTSLDVSNNIALRYIDVRGNSLSELNLDNNTNMEDLYINLESLTDDAYNYLKGLDDSNTIDVRFYGKRQ